MSTTERVILVSAADAPIGTADKQAAHVSGLLHRAFSIFVFNDAGQLLLQRRDRRKYHSGGLWSNTCCSHPRPDESTAAAAHRRLVEEMGFDCPLDTAFTFVYRAEVGGGLVEHEFDHVFTGRWNGEPAPEPAEVEAWRWIDPAALLAEAHTRPDRFTSWFHIAFAELRARANPRPDQAPLSILATDTHAPDRSAPGGVRRGTAFDFRGITRCSES